MSSPPVWAEIADHLFCIDTGLYRPGLACCYLLRDGDQLAIIDTGTTHTVPRLRDLIAALGLTPAHVTHIIPTHVHLDHAGGAGALMAMCPAAQLVVHHKGAPHLIDPTRLTASAMAVYGLEAFNTHFGQLVPIPAARVHAVNGDTDIAFANRPLRFIDTPGHANHHGCIFDAHSGGWFTGDTFGIAYPELTQHTADGLPWLFAPTTPVAFDPDLWLDSVTRLMAVQPTAMYLTHYGRLDQPQLHLTAVRDSIQTLADVALEHADQPAGAERVAQLTAAIAQLFHADWHRRGVTLPAPQLDALLQLDLALNAQGLDIWLQRRATAGLTA